MAQAARAVPRRGYGRPPGGHAGRNRGGGSGGSRGRSRKPLQRVMALAALDHSLGDRAFRAIGRVGDFTRKRAEGDPCNMGRRDADARSAWDRRSTHARAVQASEPPSRWNVLIDTRLSVRLRSAPASISDEHVVIRSTQMRSRLANADLLFVGKGLTCSRGQVLRPRS